MNYFAGLFDAEGYVSLCPNGAFSIAIEMANEKIPSLFQEKFKGKIYERKRDKKKKSWIWKINSICSETLYFIDSISYHSIIKKNQLIRLKDYLDQPRNSRKETRAITCSTIKQFKQPILQLNDIIPRSIKCIEPGFFEWISGFIDGDGNFVCNEYIDNRSSKKYFGHQVSASNIFLEGIGYINDRIEGTIVTRKRTSNIVYTWTCKRDSENFICENIIPYLRIKKNQCELFKEFINFSKKSYGVSYDEITKLRMYEIINDIKHLNSL